MHVILTAASQVPQPERYALHKLILANGRKAGIGSLKARKDRAKAAFLIEVLAEAWEVARGNGPRWRERMDASLGRMPGTVAELDGLGLRAGLGGAAAP